MLVGSTENSPTTGLAAGAGGSGAVATGAGGGGGAMGAFFLQADAKTISAKTISSSATVRIARLEWKNRIGE